MLRRNFLKNVLLTELGITAAGATGFRLFDMWESAKPVTMDLPMMDELTDVIGFLAQETNLVCLGDTNHERGLRTILMSEPSRLDTMEESGITSILIESHVIMRDCYDDLQQGRIEKDSPLYKVLTEYSYSGWIPPYQGRHLAKKYFDALHNRAVPAVVPIDYRPDDPEDHYNTFPTLLMELGEIARSLLLPQTLPPNYASLPGFITKEFIEKLNVWRGVRSADSDYQYDDDSQGAEDIIENDLGSDQKNLMIYGSGHFSNTSEDGFLPLFRKAGLHPIWINYYPDTSYLWPESRNVVLDALDVRFIADTKGFKSNSPLPQLTFKDQGMKARYQAYFTDRPEMLALVEPQAKPPEKKAALSRRAFLTRTFS